ncbi:Hypothetical_protein [Hexamita inflata]|uniref:Hypothetical_protein n=1 Tax=Hexamita inflata TaxID=28002 RepID=A0ABP1HLU6_9EUKA
MHKRSSCCADKRDNKMNVLRKFLLTVRIIDLCKLILLSLHFQQVLQKVDFQIHRSPQFSKLQPCHESFWKFITKSIYCSRNLQTSQFLLLSAFNVFLNKTKAIVEYYVILILSSIQ